MKNSLVYFYPLILGIAPAVTFYWNSGVPFAHVYSSWVLIALVIGMLIFLGTAIAEDNQKARLAAAVTAVVFFYFEIFLDLIDSGLREANFLQITVSLEQSRVLPVILFFLWALLWVFTTLVILRKESWRNTAEHYLSVVSFILLIFMTIGVVFKLNNAQKIKTQIDSLLVDHPELEAHISLDHTGSPSGEAPDIYYLIFDAFAGPEILANYYDTRIDDFTKQLEQRGFYLAENSTSNYSMTICSLPSSLNLHYWDDLVEEDIKYSGWIPVRPLLKDNLVSRSLQNRGYHLITFPTGFWPTEEIRTDQKKRHWIHVNEFQEKLILNTPLTRFFPGMLYENHRRRVDFALKKLPSVPGEADPIFAFAHILSPHPPFVFDEEGNPVQPQRPFSKFDADGYRGQGFTTADYQKRYSKQLDYLLDRTLAVIDAILAASESPPVIIIQGDHGPGSMVTQARLENNNLEERFSIFNGYYFPDQDYSALYPSITPVNTFRVVFNQYFGTGLPLLDDKNYFSTVAKPYRFTEVTELIH